MPPLSGEQRQPQLRLSHDQFQQMCVEQSLKIEGEWEKTPNTDPQLLDLHAVNHFGFGGTEVFLTTPSHRQEQELWVYIKNKKKWIFEIFQLNGQPIKIKRGQEGGGTSRTGNTLCLDDPRVSRDHAMITKLPNGSVVVENTGNGKNTFRQPSFSLASLVDQQQLAPSQQQPEILSEKLSSNQATVCYATQAAPGGPPNEDYVGASIVPGKVKGLVSRLLLVADGVGGCDHGERASREATVQCTSHFYQLLKNEEIDLNNPKAIKEAMAQSVQSAHQLIRGLNQKRIKKVKKDYREKDANISEEALNQIAMGTTLVFAVVIKGNLYVADVGDSSAVLIRKDQYAPLTQKHTYLEEAIRQARDEGRELSEEERRFHKTAGGNNLSRAIGHSKNGNNDIEVHTTHHPVKSGDTLVMCTDGLTKTLSTEQIISIIHTNQENNSNLAKLLIQTARQQEQQDSGRRSDDIAVVVTEVR
ncbi:protein phosphatase 2C domain-containing protein [Patescibacteria group bacterium]|nr:protein phosphatase 2C domain-containing protein [Patescibacteria group bacterium]